MKADRGQPTQKQKQAVENMLSGKYKDQGKAIEAAGYTRSVSEHPKTLIQSDGVQKYLKSLDKKSRKILGIGVDEAIVETYIKGLKADKPYGREGEVHADYATRKKYVDTIAEFKGLKTQQPIPTGGHNQFNFFSVPKKDQEEFNEKLKGFLIDN